MMLEPVAISLRPVVWLLLGGGIILTASRFLPNWFRRLVALTATMASLIILWSLREGTAAAVELAWEPLNFFRQGPALNPDGLSLLVGITLSGATAAAVLGVRGSRPRRTAWHGLILVALAGCLTMTMASNLLTLALGSALIDLALIAMAISATRPSGRTAWRMAVPGVASTLLLVLGAIQMSTQMGTASLLARDIPVGMLIVAGVAGALRLLIFPLHPRALNEPEDAYTLVLLMGTGIYLLARVQAIAPILADQGGMLAVGGLALLAGGALAWTAAGQRAKEGGGEQANGERESAALPSDVRRRAATGHLADSWLGLAIHQGGLSLLSVILLAGTPPWSLVGLTLALTVLVIWWAGVSEEGTDSRPVWLDWIAGQASKGWSWLRIHLGNRLSRMERGTYRWQGRRVAVLLPIVALASLAGAPLTAGAMGRWSAYAGLLGRAASPALLVTALAADILMVAGLWVALRLLLKQAGAYRPRWTALLAMSVLVIPVIFLAFTQDYLVDALALPSMETTGVSVWGLGLIYVLPWLVGSWLLRFGSHLEQHFGAARRVIGLDWLFGLAGGVAQRLGGGIYWLGQVGEGEGWWGWVLVILALGAIFLTTR